MSDQSREKKDEAQDDQELRELPEGPKPEEPQAEESQAEGPQAEEAGPEETRPEEAQLEGTRPKKKQRIMMIVLIALAVVMAIAAALVLLYNRWVRKPQLPPAPGPSASGSVPSAPVPSADPGPSSEITPDIITVQPLAGGERRSKDFYTILIFGTDVASGLTDTIMVASYDVTNQKATVLSIPRDTLVNNNYLDKGNKSINATFKQNGMGESGAMALKTEVSRLVGFVPDFYVLIDWDLVGKMVNAINGVEFEVPWRMKYDDPTQDLHIDLMPGLQTLDGEHAMQLVRWRKNNYGIATPGGGSDLNRLNIQHDFLKAVLKQTLKPQNIIRVPELIRLFNENVASDLAVENMLWFGQQAVVGGLGTEDVEFLTMPVYGTDNPNARYYGKVCPIPDQLLAIVNESLNPYVENVTMRQLDLIQMSADGNTLSATTGTLRNPAAGIYTNPNAPTGPVESDPGSTDSIESDPVSTDPTESDPGSTDPTESDPGSTDPAESDPGSMDPAESDPGSTDPAESDPVSTDPAGSDPVSTDPTESGPVSTDPIESDPVSTDPTESDPVSAGPIESDPGPEQTADPPPETGPAITDSGGPEG